MESAEEEKFTRPLGPDDQCDCNPEFAVICSFINKFGANIDLNLNIEELKNSIENQETLDASLIDIHVKLLKKLRRYHVRDQWEKALIRFAYEYSHDNGYEIQTMGYLKARPSVKLQLLRRLLEALFDGDPKFKTTVNLIEASELNLKSAGRDIEGNTYWPCVDDHGNLRVYREEPLQHKSWTTICKNTDDLKQLIEHLEATKDNKVKGEVQAEPYNPYPEIFPEYFVKEETPEPVTTTSKKVSKKAAKKGKNKSRAKKSSPLATVDEVDETVILSETKPVVSNPIKAEASESHDSRPRSISPNGSIESHVKHTLENILSTVVSSFDFIFRRNSPDSLKKEEDAGKSSKRSRPKPKKSKTEELPRRSSSRIQQLQQKKEEEEALKKQLLEIIRTSPDPNASPRESTSANCTEKNPRRDKKDKQRWRGSKGKKKLSWDKDDSDLSSTSSLSESNDESFMEALDDAINHDNEEDEFACEDEATNDEPVIIKRARTARQTVELEETSDLNTSSIVEEDKPCGRCDKSNDPEWILLCDMCDDGYHTTCCVPPLMYVPDGDWYCPTCEHKMLTIKLRTICDSVVELLATKERERLKKQKLRQAAPKKEPAAKKDHDEIVPEKRRRDILNELNEPLAVQALDEELMSPPGDELPSSYRERSSKLPKKKAKSKKKTKRIRYDSEEDDDDYDSELDRKYKKTKPVRTYTRNILESDSEEEEYEEEDEDTDDEEESSDGSSDDGEQLKTRKARAFVSYKFEEYDELIQSAICGDSDGEIPTRVERNATETCNVGRGKDMATIEALAYQQENGLIGGELNPIKQAKQRRKGRKLNDLDADSEIDIATSDESFQASSATEDMDEEEEEDEEDEATEVSTENDSSIDEIVSTFRTKSKKNKKTKKRKRYSDDSDDSDFKPRSRRAATQKVSYRESTDDEDESDPLVSSIEPVPVTRDPINELSQYCNQSSHPSNPLFSSFKMSPPHPQFYKEDEVRSLPNDLNE